MRIEDFTFEVRDENLTRLGQLLPGDLVGWESVLRFNNVGMWSIELVANLPMAQLLSTPGYGIVVSHKTAGVILSGPMISAETTYESGDPIGVVKITGVDDSVILADRLAYPDPSVGDVTAQLQAYDSVVAMKASTALFHYVEGNLVPGIAPVERAIPTMTVATDPAVGSLVSKSARFDVLGELLTDIASVDGLGFDIKQTDGVLEFRVFQPVDRTGTIRMDVANQTLSKTAYGYGAPELTHAIVAGQGQGTDRQFFDVTTTESLSAENLFNRRIESFIDQRNTSDAAELEQAGLEKLSSGGMLLTTVDVIPSSDLTMRYGDDWNLGDQVTVVVANQEVSATVTQVSIRVEPNGVFIGATVGEPNGVDFDAIVAKKQTKAQSRINALERKESAGGSAVSYIHAISALNKGSITGATIPAGTVVMFAGSQGDVINVAPAVADGTYPEHYLAGITATDILQDAIGDVIQLGFIDHIDTSMFTLGDILFADPLTPGGLSLTAGAWTTPIAAVTRVHANTGRILVRCIPGGGGGGGSIVSGDVAPANPVSDMAWFDTTNGKLFIYFEDVDSSQWVEINTGQIVDGRIDDLETRTSVLETVRPVSIGGTGASTFTSGAYLKGNGTSAISTQIGIPATDITSAQLDWARMPIGSVLQVVQTVYANHATISSGVDTAFINFSGLDTTVVPKRANSKFLIRYQINIGAYSSSIRVILKINGGYYNTIYTDGYRASSNSIFGGGGLPYNATINGFTGEYLFSNSNTNNVSVGFEIMKQDPNYNAFVNRAYSYTDPQRGYPTSTVTIMEIAG